MTIDKAIFALSILFLICLFVSIDKPNCRPIRDTNGHPIGVECRDRGSNYRKAEPEERELYCQEQWKLALKPYEQRGRPPINSLVPPGCEGTMPTR